MIFGVPERFGLEVHREPPIGDRELCRMWVWAANQVIGDIGAVEFLEIPERFFADTLLEQPRPSAEEMDVDGVLEALHRVGYTPDGWRDEVAAETYTRFSRFLVCPGAGPSFDGEMALLFAVPEGELLVWREFPSGEHRRVTLRAGEYEQVIREFLNWVRNDQCGHGP